MKKNHLLLLLAVAVVAGLAGIYFQVAQSSKWSDSKTDRTIFQNLPVNDISQIQIRSGTASVTLEKKQDEWRVAEREDYPADFAKIRELIKTLWELKAGQEMQVGPSQLGRLKVTAPGQGPEAGIEIDLKGEKESQIASLIIGKSADQSNAAAAAATTGRFVYNPAVKDRVYLVSESFLSVDPVSVGSWLDKTFITPGELKQVDQAAWSNNPGWKVTRTDAKGEWQLEDPQSGESLDKSFSQGLSSFALSFVDVRPPSVSPDETGLKDPFKVSIKTFDGFTYDFLLGRDGPDKTRYLQVNVSADIPSARLSDPKENADDKKKKDQEFDQKNAGLKERLEKEKRFEKWVYLVPDWHLEQLLKRRNEIVSKASPSPSPAVAPLPELPSTLLPNPVGLSTEQPTTAPSPSPVGAHPGETIPTTSPTPVPSPAPTASPPPSENASPEPTPSPNSTPSS
ncbi:MAG TPA: DUF4340 domain-containing protein [Chthoniobacterales bacterium]|nr:DUF4340 domain-containing protein [Chthoniobacterales bacterium]